MGVGYGFVPGGGSGADLADEDGHAFLIGRAVAPMAAGIDGWVAAGSAAGDGVGGSFIPVCAVAVGINALRAAVLRIVEIVLHGIAAADRIGLVLRAA